MDSIFETESEGIGSDIEAYCPSPRCKADTNHTVISKYEDEIRRVQCVVCGDVHAYRKPRGEAYDEPVEPPSRKFRRKASWEQFMASITEKDMEACRPYSIRDTYVEADLVSHPTFHVGFVSELLPDNKVEISFRDERRILVHNRADLASRMPAVAEMPVPRAQKKKRKKKRKDGQSAQAAGDKLGLDEKTAYAEHAAKLKLMSEREKLAVKLEAEKERAKAEREAEKIRLQEEREADRLRKEKEREEEMERRRLEREKERERKAKEREKEKARKAKERERLKAQRERERERERKVKERERIKAQRERERLSAQRERERIKAQRERERAKKQAARERARKELERKRAAAAKKKASARRTGGKKTTARRR
jgi:hypothetical protein